MPASRWHSKQAVKKSCAAASAWLGKVPDKGNLGVRSQARHLHWQNRINLITLLGKKYCYFSNTEKWFRIENQLFLSILVWLHLAVFSSELRNAQNPFESCSSVLKMRNPKGAKSDRQEKVIVAENFGNLMILAGYLNLIQSKLSFQ